MMRWNRLRSDTRYRWILFGVLALLVRVVFGLMPTWCEWIYARGIFLGIRAGWDYTLGWLPFGNLYILIAILIYWFSKTCVRIYQTWARYTWAQRLREAALSVVSFVSMAVGLFLVLWGYNYARIPLETQINLPTTPVELEQLRAEATWAQAQAIAARQRIPRADTMPLTADLLPNDLETTMRTGLESWLDKQQLPTMGRVRARWVYPAGSLLRSGASGVYLPYVCEGHVDAALHTSQQPFTMAHELGHGYGWGDEAVCNFLGYVACLEIDAPIVQYSAYLNYWRYVMGELRRLDNAFYTSLRAQISRGMHNDLEETYRILERYPNFFPQAQTAIYNTYLKTQGVTEGVRSYNRMVVLVANWRKRTAQN